MWILDTLGKLATGRYKAVLKSVLKRIKVLPFLLWNIYFKCVYSNILTNYIPVLLKKQSLKNQGKTLVMIYS